jgi:hypothetical protein
MRIFILAFIVLLAACSGSSGEDGLEDTQSFTDSTAEVGVDLAAEDVLCVPDCEGKECGSDGCGGQCASCNPGVACIMNTCACTPECEGRECGIDGCGGFCGHCTGPDGAQDDTLCLPTGLCSTCGEQPQGCDNHCFDVTWSRTKLKQDQDGFVLTFSARNSESFPTNYLRIVADSRGGMGGPAQPGTYDLAYTNNFEGGLWATILRNQTDTGFERILVPVDGTIELQVFGKDDQQFVAVINDAIFQEATVNEETGAVTQVPGGENWCMDGVELTSEVSITYPDCQADGTGTAQGDNIANFSLRNCASGEMFQLHSWCGKKTAVWFVATAAW